MEIGVFDRLFGDLSPHGSSDALGVVVPAFPGLFRGELRRSWWKGRCLVLVHFGSFRIHGRFGVHCSIERAAALSKSEAISVKIRENFYFFSFAIFSVPCGDIFLSCARLDRA